MLLTALSLALVASPAASPAETRQGSRLAIAADKLLLGDGREIEHGVLLIADGRIEAVGADVEIPSGTARIEHHGVVTPGLIALHGYSGSSADLRDSTRADLSGAYVATAFNPGHYELEEALRAGVTCQVLTPPPVSLAGGISAVVKTAGGRVLAREAHISLGFASSALSINRFPTSYSGSIAALDELFEKGEGAFAKAKAGKLPVLFEVSARHDVMRALEFARRHELQGALNGAPWAGELAEPIKESGLAVICGPLDVGEMTRTLRSVVELARAGVPIAFALDAPLSHPESMRLGAVMCVREGLSREAALKALNADAARIAGVGERVGRLSRGLDADFVLWSGDPLDLKSSVQAVFVDGKRAWAPEQRP